MKIYLITFSLLFTFCLRAQNNLPRAGEFSNNPISKSDFFNSMKSGSGSVNQILDVINFDSSNVDFKGNYPFSVSYGLSMSDSGNIVFLGSGGGIYITDVSDPQNPVVLSEVRTRSLVDACTYDPINKRLYVCAYFSGIEIWDLADLNHPVRMCRLPTEPYPRSGVVSKGNYLFFCTNNNLWSYDISDPYNPTVADELFITNELVTQIYLKGNTIYITSSNQGLKLIDITDPTNLQLIHAYSFIIGNKFDISGNYMYAVNTTGTFIILDISNSLNVNVKSAINLGGYTENVAAFDNKAYVSKVSTGGGLQIIDVTDPVSPNTLSQYAGDFQFVVGKGNYVYLSRNSDFSILDISDPLSVQYIAGIKLPGFVEDISVSGNYAYTGSNGFRVMDISDATHPVQVGYSDIAGDLTRPAGNSLVVYSPWSMTANNTIHIMDVSDPANPYSLSSYTCPDMTWDMVVRDTLAYVACWWDGVRIFNFANPNNLTQVTHTMGWTQGGIAGVDWCYAQAVAVEGNYMYIIDYGPFPQDDTYGLYIMDISDPSNPSLLNRFQGIQSHAIDVAVKDDIVYIADGYGGVEIVDVSDPMNPTVIKYVNLVDGATGIKVEGNYAYVSDYILGGVQVIDITNPANAYVAGWYKPTGCFAVGIEHNNGKIYAADGIAGFQIYRNLFEVVPVELTSFYGAAGENSITLTWSTASETNNSGFDIERSANNINFGKIGNVKGYGTTSKPQNYTFKDDGINKMDGSIYYRLKQIDFDGSYKYSNTININYSSVPTEFKLMQNYPNPFNPVTKINYQLPGSGFVTLKVYDMLGREVATLVNEQKTQGKYSVNFNASKLASGLYIYQIKVNDFVSLKKMLLLK